MSRCRGVLRPPKPTSTAIVWPLPLTMTYPYGASIVPRLKAPYTEAPTACAGARPYCSSQIENGPMVQHYRYF
jgi:hypothetical protein